MNLSNKKIKDSYGGLLNIGLTGASPGTLYEVTDGMGNVLPIEISTTEVKFTGIVSGITGAAGSNGSSGTSGINGSSGTSGINGSSGTSGINGVNGSSGTSGISGANGSSGTSGVNGAAGADGSSGTSGVNGSSGTSGVNGAAGANGSSGTSGVNGAPGTIGATGPTGPQGNAGATGATGTFDSSAVYSNLVNVLPSTGTGRRRIFSGNLTTPTTDGIFISNGASSTSGDFIRMFGDAQFQVFNNGCVWAGDNASFNGQYSILLGRGVNNNGTDGNVLIGFGAGAGGGGVRDSFAVGQSSLNGSVINAQYQDFTAAMGFQLFAKMRGALNTHTIHLNRIPGQFSWSTGSSAFVSINGYANDQDFYTNYVGRNATTPSGATAGSFYTQPGGNVMIAGSTGYNYVNPALDYASDGAAALGGVAIGQLYHNSGAVRVRLT